jgi:methyl-accepting chemotaxis protein
MDGIANFEAAHGKARASFERLTKSKIPNLAETAKLYEKTYRDCNETLQNLMVGLEQLSAVQIKLQGYSTEFSNLEKWATELRESQTAEVRAAVDSANAGSQRARLLGWVLVLGAIPFSFFFYWITRTTTQSLQSVSHRLSEVSKNVLKISSDASGSSSRLAAASTQQTTSVMESVSSMEQMKVKLGQTLRHSSEALRSSEESFKEAAEGKVAVDSMKAAMQDIERAYDRLEELNQVVRLIRDKTNIINEIVFKTQLLSFNASIEAARAGQHGRGFSVVAAEVGKLAEMSGKAAQEIGKLLDQSSRQVADIVGSTKDKVGSANQMTISCAEVFERINERAGQVKSMVNSIADAASEQEQGIHVVVRAMSDMRDSASQTDKMAHSIAQLSDTLRGHSQSLASTVNQLDTHVHGNKSTGTFTQVQLQPKEKSSNEITKRSA